MTSQLDNCIVGILKEDTDQYVGLGLLINAEYIVTCAHVVNAVLNRPQDTIEKPDEESVIRFTFPKKKAGKAIFSAKIKHWQPRGRRFNQIDDFAILCINEYELLQYIEIPPFIIPESFLNREILAFGFPQERKSNGKHIIGVCIDADAIGLVEIIDKNKGELFIKEGFSGSPVFDIASNAVIGIICSKIAKIKDTGHMLPLEIIHDTWDEFQLSGRKIRSPKAIKQEREQEALNKRLNTLEDGLKTITSYIDELKKQYTKEKISDILLDSNKNLTEHNKLTNKIYDYEQLRIEYKTKIAKLSKGDIDDEYMSEILESQNSLYTIDLIGNTKIPPKDDLFVGREQTLIDVLNLLLKNDSVALSGMKGMGGAGKTAIAIEVCYIIQETWKRNPDLPDFVQSIVRGNKYYQDGILWIRFEQDENLRVLIHEKIEDQIGKYFNESSIEDKLKAIFKFLRNFDILIVLDSAEQNEENFRMILRYIKNHFPILVTSRKDFSFIDANISVNKMTPIEALLLFQNHFLQDGSKLTPEEIVIVNQISNDVDYLPLAIKILAKKAKIYKLSIEELYSEYQESSEDIHFFELEEFAGDILEDKDIERVKNSHALYCISLSYKPLKSIEQEIFIRCGLPYFPFSKEEIAALPCFKTIKNIGLHLGELVRLSLVEKDEKNKKYFLHPLVRQFALNQAKQAGIIDSMYEEKMAAMLDASPSTFDDDNLAEILRLLRYCEEKGDYPKIYAFNEHLDKDLRNRGLWERKISINKRTLAIVNKLEGSDKKKYDIIFSMADVIGRQGHYSEEEQLYKQLINSENIEQISLNNKIYAKYRYAHALKKINNPDESLYFNFKYIKEILDQSLGEYNACSFYKNLGALYCNHDIKYSADALLANIYYETKRKQKYNHLRAIEDMLNYLIINKRYTEALHLSKNMLEYTEEIEQKELYIECLIHYINALIENNNFKEARNYLERYKTKHRSFGLKHADDYIYIFEARILLGEEPVDYQKTLSTLDNISEDNAERYTLTAEVELKRGNLEIAEDNIASAESLLLKEGDVIGAIKLLTLRARLELKRPSIIHAIQYINESVTLQKKLGMNIFKEEEEIILEIIRKLGKETYENLAIQCRKEKYSQSDLIPSYKISGLPDFVYDKLGKKMVLIPEGLAYFGSGDKPPLDIEYFITNYDKHWKEGGINEDNYCDIVYLYPFYIDMEPVSTSDYSKYKNAINDQAMQSTGDMPLTNISYDEAKEFSTWIGKSIPNIYEWEKVLTKENQYLYRRNFENKEDLNEQYLIAKSSTITNTQNQDDLLKFIIGDEYYSKIANSSFDQRSWAECKSQIIDASDFYQAIDIDIHLIIAPELSNSSLPYFWIRLIRLIAFSISLNSVSLKITVLDNLHKLDQKRITDLFSILYNELVSLYLLSRKNNDDFFLRECNRQAEFWKIVLYKKLTIEGDYEISKTLMQEFTDGKKIKDISSPGKPIEVIENYRSQNLGFRCIIPIYSNNHFKELINNKIITHAV